MQGAWGLGKLRNLTRNKKGPVGFDQPGLFVYYGFMAELVKEFFARDTLEVAKELLGKKIVRNYRGKKIEGVITETEAYHGFNDKASHASRGKTERTKIMFGEAGTIYVYLIYGMHYCLNIVTGKKDFPAAVLIRRINSGGRQISGPGKVSKFFKIDKKLNEKKLSRKSELWIAAPSGRGSPRLKIGAGRRIGVDYAGPIWARKPWRFYVKNAMV